MNQAIVPIKRLPHGADLPMPAYATEHAAGLDLMAAIEDEVILQPGQRKMIPTGIAIALPVGCEAQVRPRSGLALKHGVTVLNSPGTVDADYRGEIGVILINLGQDPFVIARGARIAQMVISAHVRTAWRQVTELSQSERGLGGFGSTGFHGPREGAESA